MNESDTNSNFISYLLRLIHIKKDLLIVHPLLMVKLFQWNRIPEQKHFQNGTVEKGVYRSLFSYCPLQTMNLVKGFYICTKKCYSIITN